MKKYLFLLLLPVFLVSCSQKPATEFGIITFFYGDVKINQSEKWTAPRIKMKLFSGDSIYTAKKSRLDIQIPGYGLVRINDNTEISLARLLNQSKESVNSSIGQGRLFCDLMKLKKNQDFKVFTPTAVAGVRGTAFLVDATQKDRSSVTVDEGFVEMADINDPDNITIVKQGETAVVRKGYPGVFVLKNAAFSPVTIQKRKVQIKKASPDKRTVKKDEKDEEEEIKVAVKKKEDDKIMLLAQGPGPSANEKTVEETSPAVSREPVQENIPAPVLTSSLTPASDKKLTIVDYLDLNKKIEEGIGLAVKQPFTNALEILGEARKLNQAILQRLPSYDPLALDPQTVYNVMNGRTDLHGLITELRQTFTRGIKYFVADEIKKSQFEMTHTLKTLEMIICRIKANNALAGSSPARTKKGP
ncbi:MAG: FecR family protein [bacterium]|nr:FecR family protein [bacterium]